MIKLAEQKKQKVRRQIASLRRTFAKLQQRGAQLPSHLQLEKKEFVMDPNMEQQLRQHAEEKVELVRKEMAWESEKHCIALRKLQMRYSCLYNTIHWMYMYMYNTCIEYCRLCSVWLASLFILCSFVEEKEWFVLLTLCIMTTVHSM